MKKKFVLFISTNTTWGGSEVLWTQTAARLSADCIVKAATNYDFNLVCQYFPEPDQHFDLQKRYRYPGPAGKLFHILRKKKYSPKDLLNKFLPQRPDLVIISQGNNVIGGSMMRFCSDLGIPFITITHLVTELSWPALTENIRAALLVLYETSKANFFVSLLTRNLHEKMIGGKSDNNKLIFNPFTKSVPENFIYPEPADGIFKIALVGRLEIFHKGYDLLFSVINREKWKQRPLHFSIFGNGPHLQTLLRWKEVNQIDNISIKEHVENVADIWRDHQLLFMPSRMEGQSLSLIEAMNFKRSAIVTRVGGTEELIEEGVSGFFAAFPTAESIDEALERAWEKRNEWKSMGETAFRYIRERHPSDAVSYFVKEISGLI